MAYAQPRSAVDELNQGMINGTFRQVSPNRGGVIEPSTYAQRKYLDDMFYGIHEAPIKELPDALPAHTPTYTPTPQAHTDRG